ncbi:hypothetical protein ACS5PU_07335 [Pedobacter sp. GSP4]|uniref:hypothetical protein n=1 Tax=Pedobacter sp. GSP4 TaxID=3453716 RepID=UPI003EEDE10E
MQIKAVKKTKNLSGKGWLGKFFKTANIVVVIAEAVLAGPLKLPLSVLLAVRYLNVVGHLVKIVQKEAAPNE